MIIDLHIHTSKGSSDSIISPEELIHKAKEKGLGAISITDHNSYKGFQEVSKIGKEDRLLVIRGIELSSRYGHLLIYGVDVNEIFKVELTKLLSFVKNKKYIKLSEMKEIFENLSLEIYTNLVDKIHENIGALVLAHPFGMYEKGTITCRYYLEEYLRETHTKEITIEKLLRFIKDRDPIYFSIIENADGIEVFNPSCLLLENIAAIQMASYLNKNQIGASDAHVPEHIGICVTNFPQVRSEEEFITTLRSTKIEPKINPLKENLCSLSLR